MTTHPKIEPNPNGIESFSPVKTKSPKMGDFTWQSGYGVFSVGASQIQVACAYIANQAEHHRKISFQDEFRRLLQRYEIEFDERYVWD